ncbi:RNA polymerase sigma factor [Tardiphaga sp.]|jgi:RNA polymerase sigma factor (sigma-70 family)|uniref:RNA polymerase sigma factor n=1 Tax=Tardiphaga sp. TaxID=1926292 RepID=UPI0037DA21B5
MTGNLSELRRRFLLRYDDLKLRLTRRLGSAELASDALQDTWLRLEASDGVAAVRHADSYLFTVAINIARDRRRAEARRLTSNEVDALLDIADEAPSQVDVAEGRSELRALEAILLELPPRQRAILLAARLEDMPRAEIAKRFRISVRLVQRELLDAQNYCAGRLKRNFYCTLPARETSSVQETDADAPGIRFPAHDDE